MDRGLLTAIPMQPFSSCSEPVRRGRLILPAAATVVTCKSAFWLVLVGACVPAPQSAPLHTLLGIQPSVDALPATATLKLLIRPPLEHALIRQVHAWFVVHRVGGPCATDFSCAGPGERCIVGRCQSSAVDSAWLSDMSRPPLSARRSAIAIEGRVRGVPEEDSIQLTPTSPLETGRRYDLVLDGLALSPASAGSAGVELTSTGAALLKLQTAELAESAPVLNLRAPRPGATEVPANLGRIVVIFSRPVTGVSPETLGLAGQDGRIPVVVDAKSPLCSGSGTGRCYVLHPLRKLRAHRRYALWNDADRIVDGRGRLLFRTAEPHFVTGAGGALEDLGRVKVGRTEVIDDCLSLSVSAGTAVDAIIHGGKGPLVAGLDRRHHELAISDAQRLLGEELHLELRSAVGDQRRFSLGKIPVSAPAARVVITEVMANPLGAEPAQEWVELQNRSDEPVNLAGWRLAEDGRVAEAEALPSVRLAPGNFAIVVGGDYRLDVLQAPPIRPTAVVIRLIGQVGHRGLSNSGESLTLHDPAGMPVSRYRPTGPTDNGVSLERFPAKGCDIPSNWRSSPGGTATPGWTTQ